MGTQIGDRVRFGDVDQKNFGSGGANYAPGKATGSPTAVDVLASLLASVAVAYANAAGLTSSLAKHRVDGQIAITLDTYTLWVWENASAAAADSTHVAPTDLSGGAGRWVAFSTTPQTLSQLTIQSGTSTLVAGVSAALAATITANSRIVAMRKDKGASTAIGLLAAIAADRVIGAPGSFKVTSQKADASGTETADVSTFDWHIIG